MTPITGRDSYVIPILMQQAGKPLVKLVVPSIGSTIQCGSLPSFVSSPAAKLSSPINLPSSDQHRSKVPLMNGLTCDWGTVG
jgi:hypothetical protein